MLRAKQVAALLLLSWVALAAGQLGFFDGELTTVDFHPGRGNKGMDLQFEPIYTESPEDTYPGEYPESPESPESPEPESPEVCPPLMQQGEPACDFTEPCMACYGCYDSPVQSDVVSVSKYRLGRNRHWGDYVAMELKVNGNKDKTGMVCPILSVSLKLYHPPGEDQACLPVGPTGHGAPMFEGPCDDVTTGMSNTLTWMMGDDETEGDIKLYWKGNCAVGDLFVTADEILLENGKGYPVDLKETDGPSLMYVVTFAEPCGCHYGYIPREAFMASLECRWDSNDAPDGNGDGWVHGFGAVHSQLPACPPERPTDEEHPPHPPREGPGYPEMGPAPGGEPMPPTKGPSKMPDIVPGEIAPVPGPGPVGPSQGPGPGPKTGPVGPSQGPQPGPKTGPVGPSQGPLPGPKTGPVGPSQGPKPGPQTGPAGPTKGPSQGPAQAPAPISGPTQGPISGPGPVSGPTKGPAHAPAPISGPTQGPISGPGPVFGPTKGPAQGPAPISVPSEGPISGPGPVLGPSEGPISGPGPVAGPSEGPVSGPGPVFGPIPGPGPVSGPTMGPVSGPPPAAGPSVAPVPGMGPTVPAAAPAPQAGVPAPAPSIQAPAPGPSEVDLLDGTNVLVQMRTGVELTSGGCPGSVTFNITTSGGLAPYLLVSPTSGTIPEGGKADLTIALTKTLDAGKYKAKMAVQFSGSSPACLAALLDRCLSKAAMHLTTENAVASIRAKSTGPSRITVTLLLHVMPGDLAADKLPILKGLLKLKQGVDPDDIISWDPASGYCSFPGVTCTTTNVAGGVWSSEMSLLLATEEAKAKPIELLDLAGQGLDGSLPDDPDVWEALSQMTVIDLSNNNLQGTIPAGLGKVTTLVRLDLSNNKLSGCIPSELESLSGAAMISLDGNAGICGGLPRPVARASCPSLDLTGAPFPCFVSPITVVMHSGTTLAMLAHDSEMLFSCTPDPLMLESFNAIGVFYRLASLPASGQLLVSGMDGALTVGSKVPLMNFVTGLVSYSRAAGQSGMDEFVWEVLADDAKIGDVTFLVLDTSEPWGFPVEATATRWVSGVEEDVKLSELEIGDKVKTVCSNNGSVCWDDVIAIPFTDIAGYRTFYQIQTSIGSEITLAGLHYVPTSMIAGTTFSTATFKAAKDVTVGDHIWALAPGQNRLQTYQVAGIVGVSRMGNLLPLTLQGRMLVDGVAVSTNVLAGTTESGMQGSLTDLHSLYQAWLLGGAAEPSSDLLKAQAAIASILSKSSPDITTLSAALKANNTR